MKLEMYYENELFENIKLENEILDGAEFIDCEFKNCVFEELTFNRCTLSDCKFVKCNIISLQTQYSQIKNTEFYGCNLIGVHWNELMPTGKVFEPISKLSDCFLKYAAFINMNFIRFDFSSNSIQESAFDECNLRESNFKGCQLERTHYTNCDMRKADFRETSGYQIDLKSNNLENARFSFPQAINLLNCLGIKID